MVPGGGGLAEGVKSGAVMTSLASAGVFFFWSWSWFRREKKVRFFVRRRPPSNASLRCFSARFGPLCLSYSIIKQPLCLNYELLYRPAGTKGRSETNNTAKKRPRKNNPLSPSLSYHRRDRSTGAARPWHFPQSEARPAPGISRVRGAGTKPTPGPARGRPEASCW